MLLAVQMANLALRFLLELFALGAMGYWGFHTGRGLLIKVGLAIGAPLLAAVIWGAFGSPAAPRPLSGLPRLALEFAIFGSAAAALYAAGSPSLAGVFGLAVVINKVLMTVWGQ